MDDGTVIAICDDFYSRFNFQDPDMGREAESLFTHALRALPEPDAAAIGISDRDDPTPRALLLDGDRLVEVWAFRDDDALPRIASRSRPLADSGVVIEFEWGDRAVTDRGVEYRTTWAFKFADGGSVSVRGRVRTSPEEALDPGEEFARAAAARVGEVAAPR